MQNSIYQVKGCIYHPKNKDLDLINLDKIFEATDLLSARKAAFSYFDSYLDVIEEASKNSFRWVSSSNKKNILLNETDLTIYDDDDKGLFLYFIPNKNEKLITKEGEIYYPNKLLIRCADNGRIDFDKLINRNLQLEKEHF